MRATLSYGGSVVTQSTPEQRAEAARLLALRANDGTWYPAYADAGERLLTLLPALLADAEALADFAALAREIRAIASDGDNIAVSGETMRGWAAELERATGDGR
jgi:hypothetical protein